MKYTGSMLIVIICMMFIVQDRQINALQKAIKESRQREDLLYQECKQLDYLTSVMTVTFKEAIEVQSKKLQSH